MLKNKINKKNISRVLVTTLAFQASVAVADPFTEGTGKVVVQRMDQASNPFTEGTGRQRLSLEERGTLLQYAANAKAVLDKALRQSQGLDFPEAKEVLVSAIQNVIIDSFNYKASQELLMRHVLNQALELTVGLPHTGLRGLLEGSVNEELIVVILEESARMATGLYHDDRYMIETGNYSQKPVMRTAVTRLDMARDWASAIIENEVSFDFQKMALQQFLNTAMVDDNINKVAFAEELVEADNILARYEAKDSKNMSLREIMIANRYIRGEVMSIARNANAKANSMGLMSSRRR